MTLRVAFDLSDVADTSLSERQLQALDDLVRTWVKGVAQTTFDQPHYEPKVTLHVHHSTRNENCAGCYELAQDGINNNSTE
jgi:hypothetical protein